MKRLIATIGAAALAASSLATPSVSYAYPNASEWSHEFERNQDVCVNTAKAAFVREGWGDIDVQSKYTVFADKGKLTGVILCLYETETQAIAVCFVAGGPAGLAGTEADRLEADVI